MRAARTLIIALALSPATLLAQSPGQKWITPADIPGPWPLVAREGMLACTPAPHGTQIVTFRALGKTYAVNGTASSRGYVDIEPIWLDNDAIPGAKINIGPLIRTGIALCR